VTVAAPAPERVLPESVTARWSRRHYLVIAGIALLQMCIRAEVPLGQDMLWGARFGVDFLDSGHLTRTDTYSWTAHGQQWVPNSWGWNVVLGLVYRSMGVVGFWLLGAALAVLMALVVARAAERLGAHPLATLALYVPIGFLGLAAVPRAQTVSTIALLLIPPLVVATVFGDRRESGRALAALAALQLVWINVHSAAMIGPVLVVATGTALLVARRRTVDVRRAAARLIAAAAATTLACAATPYGFAPVLHADDVRRTSAGLVTEWDHIGFGSVAQVLGLAAVLTCLALAVRVWRAGRPEIAAGLVLLCAATGGAIRFLPMLGVFAVAEAALVVGRLDVRDRMLRVMVAATTVVLAGFALLDARDLRSLGDTVSPRLVAELPSECRLLNDDLAGDAVTLLRPDILVSLDGRYDMYGREIIVKVENLFNDRPGTGTTLAADHVTCVLGPSAMPLVRRLSASSRWTVLGTDSVRTLLVLDAGASP
jgi:hypothetical protein